MYGALFWVGVGVWENIFVGWGWVGMSGGEWGWMHCLIMPDRKISFEIWRCLKYGGSNYGKSLIIVC